jgi:hypothetical protein
MKIHKFKIFNPHSNYPMIDRATTWYIGLSRLEDLLEVYYGGA